MARPRTARQRLLQANADLQDALAQDELTIDERLDERIVNDDLLTGQDLHDFGADVKDVEGELRQTTELLIEASQRRRGVRSYPAPMPGVLDAEEDQLGSAANKLAAAEAARS